MNKPKTLILSGNLYNENKLVLKELKIEFLPNKVYALIGKNGSGKSTLIKSVFGLDNAKIDKRFYGKTNLESLKIDEIARLGISITYQEPPVIKNVSYKLLDNILKTNLDSIFPGKSINYKISGGEKKLSEIKQLISLKPNIIFLDELDSGVDVKSLKQMCLELLKIPNATFVIVSHSGEIFKYLKPQSCYVIDKQTIKIQDFDEYKRELKNE